MDKRGLLSKTELELQHDPGYRLIMQRSEIRRRIAEIVFEEAKPAFFTYGFDVSGKVEKEFGLDASLRKACEYLLGTFRLHRFLFDNYLVNDPACLKFVNDSEFRHHLRTLMANEGISGSVYGRFPEMMKKVERTASKLKKKYPDIDAVNFLKFHMFGSRYRNLIMSSIKK